ncbi:alpha-amylase family glycosyl hydrolase [Aliiglaciecola sp. M165]|uniref:alpha-amylase family glycosyl hydrolase n=1 Tax=Aliiglaciecola sp. M165 TaxID=2593649 RepID=UPI00163D5847|nr:alpha-amylase family glycosyl hydrolase [Aliiglaciecola sp. M165]
MPIVTAAEPWWKGACLYQIYPRSFNDSSGNGIGDLNGILEKLDYIADLGVDGIWISPFFLSPMKDFGYDVSDHTAVDPLFGDLNDFKNLVSACHQRNLKVIIDQVYSHTSDQHEWFKQSRLSKDNPYSDWYIWADAKADGSAPSNWQSVFSGPAWTWDNRRKQYYLHNFLTNQPDLNLHNPDVQEAIFDVAKFWLELGVDGFRLDAINYGMHNIELFDNPPNPLADKLTARPYTMQQQSNNMSHQDMPMFLEKFRQVLEQFDEVFTVAEVGGNEPTAVMKSYISANNKLSTAYSFDFLTMQNVSGLNLQKILQPWDTKDDEHWPSWAFSNHDVPRVLSRWSNGQESPIKAKLFQTLLISLRGNIFLYQCEELGMRQASLPFHLLQDPEGIANWPDSMGRDGARTPMPWDHAKPNFDFTNTVPWLPADFASASAADSVSAQVDDEYSVLNYTKALIRLRKQSSALKYGEFHFIECATDVVIIKRIYRQEELLCVFNFSAQEQAVNPLLFEKSAQLISNFPDITFYQSVPGNYAGIFICQ